ncbi:MAG: flagellar biosynthetic protein FliQ [Phycisphaerales bacterium]|nr:flagellar biosynthetic protein FliQ [Phycisphaerales bacterium]
MAPESLVRIVQQGLMLAIMVGAPALIAALLVGAIVGIVQSATQVQDSSVVSVPKVLAVAGVIVLAGVWMLAQVVGFGEAVLGMISQVR